MELCPAGQERDRQRAVRQAAKRVHRKRAAPHRQQVFEGHLPRVHRRDVHSPEAAAGGPAVPGDSRADHPCGSGRHDQSRFPQQWHAPVFDSSARRLLREEFRRSSLRSQRNFPCPGRRGGAARRHLHLYLAGARARRTGPERSQLDCLALPFACDGEKRRQFGADRRDCRDPARRGQSRRNTEGNRPRIRGPVHDVQRKRQLVPATQHSERTRAIRRA